MFPSINILNKTISMYNIMALIGIFVGLIYVIKICKRKSIDDSDVIATLMIGFIGVFIGGHILYAITRIDLIILFIQKINKITSFSILIDCLREIFGGSVFYGGLIGGMITSTIYIKKKKLNIPLMSDLCAPVIPLFHFFGRIGCFLVGCCYGIESKIGFTYKHALIDLANNVKRFPIQLVESSYNLILFIILYNLYKKDKLRGKLIYLYLILYSIARFIFEFFRGDSYRGFLFGLSTSQIISVFVLIFGIYFLSKKKNID